MCLCFVFVSAATSSRALTTVLPPGELAARRHTTDVEARLLLMADWGACLS